MIIKKIILALFYPFSVGVFCLLINPISKAEDNWLTIETQYCRLNYKAAYSTDVEKIKKYFQYAVRELLIEFSKYEPEKLLSSAKCNIFLHPTPNEKASESTALAYTGIQDNQYFVDLHFLTPSAYKNQSLTNTGQLKDENYFLKLIIHEYSTVILERITTNKSKGWHFFSAPQWFIQGYEEYLGVVHSSNDNRNIITEYLQLLEKDPTRIDLDFGIEVKDPYIDGCILLAFMYETFGQTKVQSILTNQSDTFGKAIKSQLGVDLSSFSAQFEKWKKSRINSNFF